MKIVAFTGNSNSGKTTLIEKLSLHLKTQNKRVGIIKHDPKDKAMFDVEGKDSARFYQTGADVAILGATQSTLRFHKALSIKSLVGQFVDYDYLFVEGLKILPFPRICVARDSFDTRFLPYIQAIATDSSIPNLESYALPLLNLNNTLEILEWIDINIKES
ncbi:molybdopterin-guanine dinucleotide biosynthesis protein B [Helicobacter sp. UBA3407]|nr:molybdopterin-guanine dinucleotide biosynthesis protein B [Helicobacter sp. UBA3407]